MILNTLITNKVDLPTPSLLGFIYKISKSYKSLPPDQALFGLTWLIMACLDYLWTDLVDYGLTESKVLLKIENHRFGPRLHSGEKLG